MEEPAVGKITDRFLAYLLDTLPFGAGYLASGLYLIAISRRLAPTAWPAWTGLWVALYLLYHAIGNWRGATIGKALMGLRVAGPGGEPPGALRSFARAAALLLSTPLDLGFLWAFVDRDSRTWHDLIAGTRVVEARRKSLGESRATALAAFGTLGGLLLITAWVYFLQPTPQDALAIAKAQDGLRVMAMIEERHKAAHGAYTQSLADLAVTSGDVQAFKAGLRQLFDPQRFVIAADRDRYAFSARALDRRRTVVSLVGPAPPGRRPAGR